MAMFYLGQFLLWPISTLASSTRPGSAQANFYLGQVRLRPNFGFSDFGHFLGLCVCVLLLCYVLLLLLLCVVLCCVVCCVVLCCVVLYCVLCCVVCCLSGVAWVLVSRYQSGVSCVGVGFDRPSRDRPSPGPPKISLFFFPLPPQNSFFLLSLDVFSWNCATVHDEFWWCFEGRDPHSKCARLGSQVVV